MNRISAWVRSFFGFSRTETNGFLILLPLMLIVLFAEPIYQAWFTSQPLDLTDDSRMLDSLVATWKYESSDSVVNKTLEKNTKVFLFDPNLISAEEFISLGFKKNVANRIVNFRLKGGKFRIKTDLKKIFSIDTSLVITLYPFITLPNAIEKSKPIQLKEQPKTFTKKVETIDINLADTTQLIQLKGIGSKLSLRIIKYRDRMGGFVSQDQLKEVYGLDTLVIKELKTHTFITEEFVPKQININRATEREITALPYIKLPLAKAIVAYRFQHGNYASTDDLKKIALLEALTFEKIKPYLTVKE